MNDAVTGTFCKDYNIKTLHAREEHSAQNFSCVFHQSLKHSQNNTCILPDITCNGCIHNGKSKRVLDQCSLKASDSSSSLWNPGLSIVKLICTNHNLGKVLSTLNTKKGDVNQIMKVGTAPR